MASDHRSKGSISSHYSIR